MRLDSARSAPSSSLPTTVVAPVSAPPTIPWVDSPEFERSQSIADDADFTSDLSSMVWSVVSRLRTVSSLLCSAECSVLSPAKCVDISTKSIRGRMKSVSSIKSALGHVASYLDFFSDSGLSDTAELAGEASTMALRDFFESLHVRGQTVPRTARNALSVFKDALGAPWPLDHPLIVSAVAVEDPTPPKQAPSFPLELVLKFDTIASDPLVVSGKRLFASAILLMTLTSLRSADVQRSETLETNESSVFGTLLSSKTKRPHGLGWPFAAPLSGFRNSSAWIKPILDFRAAFYRVNGVGPSFLIPKLSFSWDIEGDDAISYSAARRKLLLLCLGAGAANYESYTTHTPKNFYRRARTKCLSRRMKRI